MPSVELKAIVVSILWLGTTIALFSNVKRHYFALLSRKWPSVIGKAISAEISSREGGEMIRGAGAQVGTDGATVGVFTNAEFRTYYKAGAEVEYFVNSNKYICKEVAFNHVAESAGKNEVNSLLNRINKEFPVVYYNPNNPSQSVLVNGPFTREFVVFSCVLISFNFALAFWLYMRFVEGINL